MGVTQIVLIMNLFCFEGSQEGRFRAPDVSHDPFKRVLAGIFFLRMRPPVVAGLTEVEFPDFHVSG